MRGHPSDLSWSKFLSDDLGWWEKRGFTRHLQHCHECQRERDTLLAEQKAFDAAPERKSELDFLNSQARIKNIQLSFETRSSRWRWTVAAPLAAACMALLIAVFTIQHAPPENDSTIRTKGDNTLVIYAQRNGKVSAVQDVCHPGEKLRARYWTSKKFIFVVGSDSTDPGFYPLYPMEETRSEQVITSPAETPDSWILDENAGVQQIIAVFSERPLEFREVAKSLERTKSGDIVVNNEDFTISVFECQKRPQSR